VDLAEFNKAGGMREKLLSIGVTIAKTPEELDAWKALSTTSSS
jgi:hypothetical protein